MGASENTERLTAKALGISALGVRGVAAQGGRIDRVVEIGLECSWHFGATMCGLCTFQATSGRRAS